jgi:hypothetical protein
MAFSKRQAEYRVLSYFMILEGLEEYEYSRMTVNVIAN